MAAASTARHETRALLRAHLAAASRYGHVTRHCPVCHRLLRLAMELPPTADEPASQRSPADDDATEEPAPDPAHDSTDDPPAADGSPTTP